jgi:hypothetical protein
VKPQSVIVITLVATFLLSSCSTYGTRNYSNDAYNTIESKKGDDNFQDAVAYIKHNVTAPLVVIHIITMNDTHVRVYSYDEDGYIVGENVSDVDSQEIKTSIDNIKEINIKIYHGEANTNSDDYSVLEQSSLYQFLGKLGVLLVGILALGLISSLL